MSPPRRGRPDGPEGSSSGMTRLAAALDDAREADAVVERHRRLAAAAADEATERLRRASAHAGRAGHPRAQGLWDAAAFHAARARAAAGRLAAAEEAARVIRARAAEARAAAGSPGRLAVPWGRSCG